MDKTTDFATRAREIQNFRCVRFDALPDIPLYMDQVISIVENRLSVFASGESEKILSPSMVNNYVKQKVLPPPLNKRYTREHVAYLLCICILKKVLSISQIQRLLDLQRQSWPVETVYDRFCGEVEAALSAAFCPNGGDSVSAGEEGENIRLLRSAALSFAHRIYLEQRILSLDAATE
ncbi:MAG: DUF1836 domain-containing protein [Candidatus Howiella sp.]|jgi:DNA-binding transcriptional MerR regulator